MSEFFGDEKEPEHKIPFVTLKEQHWLWDGEKWMHMHIEYSVTAVGKVGDSIKEFAIAKQKKEKK